MQLGRSIPASSADVHAPAANTAAVVTYAASTTGASHVITGVVVSYNAAPTGGNLKIEDGSGVVVFTTDIAAAGVFTFVFDNPKRGTSNTALIITLAAGGASATGKVSVLTHYSE